MSDIKPVRVLFVCMGNICRSPTAHGVFQALVEKQGLGDSIRVDSAGTHSYHVGNAPDPRSQATARARGVDLSGLRARRFVSEDFLDFDYLVAMDRDNLADMLAIKPENASARAELMLDYATDRSAREIPDPYYGNDGFELVYGMIVDASGGLLRQIRGRHRI
ncbi:MAG TPA: low molecular weight protein-tyrosine-phosphatase [Gammaproteobacteria bacterium]|nr:low molecular weight protein-tyrosine-phosphatase [Gammaproteobacteria bacterium]